MRKLPQWAKGVHHDGSVRFVSNPYPKADEVVTLYLRTPSDAPIKYVFLRAMLDGEFKRIEMTRSAADEWQATIEMTQPKIDYRFKLVTEDGISYFYTAKGLSRADSPDFYDFSLLIDYTAPTWVHDAIFYQIFPDRFHNGDPSNDVQDNEYMRFGYPAIKREWHQEPLAYQDARSMDFFGGDLQGITQKLDYLKDLGVNAVYLCPIFTAESNHKYDIMDFWEVDTHFGGNEALAELRAELSKRDMYLMLDITPNHISYANSWFVEAKDNPEAETAEYFFFYGDGYEKWLGVPSLVKLNYTSQKLRDRMYRDADSALRFWLKPPYSIDAWRLDVANMTGNLKNLQLDHDVWQEVRSSVKAERDDIYLLGEYFQDGTPHLQGDELDASMNYQGFNTPMRRWLGGADLGSAESQPFADNNPMATEALAEQWDNFMAAIPYVIALQQFNQLGSHDITRILHVTGGDAELVKLGLALLLAFPGVPCIYYGDEIGLDGGRDPYNRRPFPWHDESKWDRDLYAYHQQAFGLRQQLPALKFGGFQLLHAAGDLIAFQRHTAEQTVIVVGYRGETTTEAVGVDVMAGGLGDETVLMDGFSESRVTIREGQVTLNGIQHGQALYLVVQR